MARLLVFAIATMTSLPAGAGDELADANDTTFDASVVSLDNSVAGETTFTIDTTRTEIGWQDLQQPADNTLEFHFVDPNADSAVLNRIGANRPPSLDGTVISNGTVAFSSAFGLFIGSEAVVDVGSLVAVGADISRDAFLANGAFGAELTGDIVNHGTILADQSVALIGRNVLNTGEIQADQGHVLMLAGDVLHAPDWDAITRDFLGQKEFFGLLRAGRVDNRGLIQAPNAALVGGRVANHGEIAIADGSLMMIGADAVYLSRFDDPVFVRLPHTTTGAGAGEHEYAIENHGQIDAGLGHVRLAAADPLGFGIRQGSGAGSSAAIRAREIDLEGGDVGRVHLSGTVDASDATSEGRGGEIDVTGSLIALEDATLDASGSLGGGRIRVGGEQQGSGDLQRARAVVVDEDSAIHADALEIGDGGDVIVFAEDLTSVDGALSARGGARGGDGGFVETSGLKLFAISRTPDLAAPNGSAGAWLIDPYDITIQAPAPGDPNGCDACLNNAVLGILDPNFDDTAFDGILRTVDPASNGILFNEVDPFLLAQALGIGTSVTLSTQAFGVDNNPSGGDITVAEAIVIDSDQALLGTEATLTLLAAGNINVDREISVALNTTTLRRNVRLNVDLRANDLLQTDPSADFNATFVEGDVAINANITTGGGSVTASGIAVSLDSAASITTEGGSVRFASGTIDASSNPGSLIAVTLERDRNDPSLTELFNSGVVPLDTRVEIGGNIDTRIPIGSRDLDIGGEVALSALSVNVTTSQSGDDPLELITGELSILETASISTGGGDVQLAGGITAIDGSQSNFVGDVDIAGNTDVLTTSIDSGGGDVVILSNRLDPNGEAGDFFPVFVDPSRSQGGEITILDTVDGLASQTIATHGGELEIGADQTRSIALDGDFDTRVLADPNGSDNGLIRLRALDSSDPNAFGVSDSGVSGQASITIGADDSAVTRLRGAGLSISSRDVSTSTIAAANGVRIELQGSAESELDADGNPVDGDPIATSGLVDITGSHQIDFNENTEIAGETIEIAAAEAPLTIGTAERSDGEVRVSFGGGNDGVPASQGVLLRGDSISITIGDGTTPSENTFAQDTGTLDDPTDFGILRQTTGNYQGLQLRDFSGAERPEEFAIQQDGDLTITDAAATAAGELYLAGAFGAAAIGSNGLETSLSSADGILTVQDSAPFDSGGSGMESVVVLNGGLFLPIDDMTPPPGVARNSVVFGGGSSTVAFDVESLTITTPGDYTIDDATRAAFGTTNELVVQAGRSTGIEGVAARGTLTVEGGPGFELRATDRLLLHAAGSGLGDLVFADTTLLASNDIGIRAGGGTSSVNDGSAASPTIQGVQANVDFTDGQPGLNDFGGALSTATAFSYRQDAAIDAATDLPDLDQLLTLPAMGFQVPIDYEVRSDGGIVLLDDGVAGTNEGDRFSNASLRLVGFQNGDTPAIAVSSDFAVTGPRVFLGAVSDFTFSQQLAAGFNRADNSLDQLTLRAGLGFAGQLNFDSGGQGPVQVKASRVDFVAGDGAGGDFGSSIDVEGAEIVLTGERAFTFQNDTEINFADFPTAGQFAGGVLPRIYAVRGSGTSILFDGYDSSGFTIDSSMPGARLILEADTITLNQDEGGDLYVTNNPAVPNLNTRLRANTLNLFAFDVANEGDNGRVFAGLRAGESPTLMPGDDASFDLRSLLVEAFDTDTDVDLATTTNLSSLSEVPNNPGIYDLAIGRSPTNMAIAQDGMVTEDELPDFRSISGLFARTIEDDADDNPIATRYSVQSIENTTTVKPENIENANAVVTGRTPDLAFPDTTGVTFLAGSYMVDSLLATSFSTILVSDGVSITANDEIDIQAGLIFSNSDVAVTATGDLRFEAGPGTTSLQADRVLLAAGPDFEITDPDIDDDGIREEILDAIAPRIDFAGLDSVVLNSGAEDSLFSVRQSASLDVTSVEGDFLKAFAGIDTWTDFDITSQQGTLSFGPGNLETIANNATNLSASALATRSALVIDVPLVSPTVASFDAFTGTVRLESLDITLRTSDPLASLDLGGENYQLIADDVVTGFEPDSARYRLLDDPFALDRAIVRFEQTRDLNTATLPGGDRYFRRFLGGDPQRRVDFSQIDIVLETDGTQLTFDDALRDRVSGSNLTLISAGSVDIEIGTVTPGYENIEGYADVQLASLGIFTPDTDSNGDGVRDGTISFSPGPSGSGLSIETLGDQQFDGLVILEDTITDEGRNISFDDDITRISSGPDVGLNLATTAKIVFGGNIGLSPVAFDPGNPVVEPLAFLRVAFDGTEKGRTPNAEFGMRVDLDGDDIDETPVASDQQVFTRDEVLFYSVDFRNPVPPTDLTNPAFARDSSANFATVGKALGNLSFGSTAGNFQVSTGEKISVGGILTLDMGTGDVQIGDVTALELRVLANTIGLLRRPNGINRDITGETQKDAGPAIVANVIDFGGVTPSDRGSRRRHRFALPDISSEFLPDFSSRYSFYEIKPSGEPLDTGDFVFASDDPELLQQVPSWQPKGASRSDLSGAAGPRRLPVPRAMISDPLLLANAERLLELAVDARETRSEVIVARLESVAVIDDLDSKAGDEWVTVTDSRLDARDSEIAIQLYEKLFGPDGERAGNVREILQEALDNYLETTRARRVVGFELRRFVKNRPSTLLNAYSTLAALDSLFRYHRRLGLSPGEFRRIQSEWLRMIQPEGISLDELSEAIHPSRYVRGSDILDIFGQ